MIATLMAETVVSIYSAQLKMIFDTSVEICLKS